MPTINDLLKQADKARELAEDYQNMALETKSDESLSKLLMSLALEGEAQAKKLTTKINHLLEIEQW